jgi:hypothetical protein
MAARSNSNVNGAPKKLPKAATAALVIIVCAVTLAAMFEMGIFNGFTNLGGDNSPQPSLSPARNLVGTWKTAIATQFLIQIDGSDVGSQDRTMTWKITSTSQESVVNVEITFSTSNTQVQMGSGYVPDVSPMGLKGTISGTRLTLTNTANYYKETVGEFTFTTDYIQGTWHDHWEMLYDQNVYTATNGLKMDKQ